MLAQISTWICNRMPSKALDEIVGCIDEDGAWVSKFTV